MNSRFHVSLNFSSDDESYDEYDYSYEEDDISLNVKASKNSLKEKTFPPAPIHAASPHRAIRSNILRPIPKMKTSNNSIPRPQTSESMLNCQTHSENNSQNDKSVIENPEFIEERFYAIEMKRFKNLFGSTHKRFLMSEQNQLIYDLIIKSKDKLIKLPNKHHLEISKGHTEFNLKSEEQFQKELMKINFCPPHENDQCQRRTVVRFFNMNNYSLPRKLISLGSNDDDNFRGHYRIPSIRNTALVVQGSKSPILSILEQEKNRIEIRTTLNIDKEIIFALAIATFLGKNCSDSNSFIQGLKGFAISPALRPIMTHEKVII